jgi:hypothetical protein
MTTEATPATAAAETPSDASAPADSAGASSAAESPDPTPAPDGTTPPAEATEEPATPSDVPDARKLTKWSQKLTRREERVKADRAELEAAKKSHEADLQLAKAFESKKVKPLIEAYAKRHALTFEQAFNALTHEAVNPGVPTVEEVVDARLTAKAEAEQKAAQERQEKHVQGQIYAFVQKANPYVREAMEKHEYLATLEPDLVARVAIDTVVNTFLRTGQEISLDSVLTDMNAHEKTRVEKHLSRLRPGDPQVQANSERENGAGQSAKLEARKRGSPQTLNNSHAAQQATAPADDEDLSDKALTAKAVKALRGIPGWH